jgi:hypothetical protein
MPTNPRKSETQPPAASTHGAIAPLATITDAATAHAPTATATVAATASQDRPLLLGAIAEQLTPADEPLLLMLDPVALPARSRALADVLEIRVP